MTDQLPLPGLAYDARALLRLLIDRYQDKRWIVLPELRIGSGYGADSEQRIDCWVMSAYPSDHMVKLAFEIKVSRGDFRQELKKPMKRRWALRYSNLFYFVAPPGLLKPEELPLEAGLMEPNAKGQLAVSSEAPHRDAHPPAWRLVASIARRQPIKAY
jgi:hypothetical protein